MKHNKLKRIMGLGLSTAMILNSLSFSLLAKEYSEVSKEQVSLAVAGESSDITEQSPIVEYTQEELEILAYYEELMAEQETMLNEAEANYQSYLASMVYPNSEGSVSDEWVISEYAYEEAPKITPINFLDELKLPETSFEETHLPDNLLNSEFEDVELPEKLLDWSVIEEIYAELNLWLGEEAFSLNFDYSDYIDGNDEFNQGLYDRELAVAQETLVWHKEILPQHKEEDIENSVSLYNTTNTSYNATSYSGEWFEFTDVNGNIGQLKFDADTNTITGSETTPGMIWDIPKEINGTEVKFIGQHAFSYGTSSIATTIYDYSVVIPNTIETIGNYAFKGIRGTVSFEENSALMTLGTYCFKGANFTGTVEFPESVTAFSNYCFYEVTFDKALVIPNSVQSFGNSCFYEATFEKELIIPDSVQSFGTSCFNSTTFNEVLVIPDTVKTFGSGCFQKAIFNEKITVSEVVKNSPTSSSSSYFASATFNGDVLFPDSITTIGNYCFYNATINGEIKFSNSLTAFGNSCFYGVTFNSKLEIPDNVTLLGSSCFKYATFNKDVTLSGGVMNNASYSYNSYFYNATFNESVIFSDSVLSIGTYCFYKTTFSKDVILSDSITRLGADSFCETTFNEKLVLSQSIESFGTYCFNGSTFFGELIIPDTVVSLSAYCFQRAVFYKELVIPDSITSLSNACFYEATFEDKLIIPDSVTNLGSYCFFEVEFSEELIIPDSVTTFGNCCFQYAIFDKEVTLSSAVSNPITFGDNGYFRYSIFNGDVSFTNSVTSFGQSCFYEATFNKQLNIPDTLTSFGSYCFVRCMFSEKLIIPELVTAIPTGCFNGATFTNGISIPDGVVSIDNYAFYNIVTTNSISLPSQLENIGNYGLFSETIEACINLESSFLPESLNSIGENGLIVSNTELIFPSESLELATSAIYIHPNLKSISIPTNTTSTGENSIWGDESSCLETVYFIDSNLDNNTDKSSLFSENLLEYDGLLFYLNEDSSINNLYCFEYNDDGSIKTQGVNKVYLSNTHPKYINIFDIMGWKNFDWTVNEEVSIQLIDLLPIVETSINANSVVAKEIGNVSDFNLLAPSLLTHSLTSVTVLNNDTGESTIFDSSFFNDELLRFVIPTSDISFQNLENDFTITALTQNNESFSTSHVMFIDKELPNTPQLSVDILVLTIDLGSPPPSGIQKVEYRMRVMDEFYSDWEELPHDQIQTIDLSDEILIIEARVQNNLGVYSNIAKLSKDAPEGWYLVDGVEGGMLHFDTETGTITGSEPSITIAHIPTHIDGVEVKHIGPNSFCHYDTTTLAYTGMLEEIVLPYTVESIGNHAFMYWENNGKFSVDETEFPSQLTSIGFLEFAHSSTKSVIIPNSVTSIGTGLFYGDPSSSTSNKTCSVGYVKLSSSIEVLPSFTFWGTLYQNDYENFPETGGMIDFGDYSVNNKLKTIQSSAFVWNVKYYGEGTSTGFDNFSMLIQLPDSVEVIEKTAFGSNFFIQWGHLYHPIALEKLPTSLKTLESSAFVSNNIGKLVESKQGSVGSIYYQNTYELIIPEGVEHIKEDSLGKITTYYIGAAATSGLTLLTLPDSISSIDGSMRSYSDGPLQLTSKYLPLNLEVIKRMSFYLVGGQEFIISENTREVQSASFATSFQGLDYKFYNEYYEALESVSFTSGLKRIGYTDTEGATGEAITGYSGSKLSSIYWDVNDTADDFDWGGDPIEDPHDNNSNLDNLFIFASGDSAIVNDHYHFQYDEDGVMTKLGWNKIFIEELGSEITEDNRLQDSNNELIDEDNDSWAVSGSYVLNFSDFINAGKQPIYKSIMDDDGAVNIERLDYDFNNGLAYVPELAKTTIETITVKDLTNDMSYDISSSDYLGEETFSLNLPAEFLGTNNTHNEILVTMTTSRGETLTATIQEKVDTYKPEKPSVTLSGNKLMVTEASPTLSGTDKILYRLQYAGENYVDEWHEFDETMSTEIGTLGLEGFEVVQVNNAGTWSDPYVWDIDGEMNPNVEEYVPTIELWSYDSLTATPLEKGKYYGSTVTVKISANFDPELSIVSSDYSLDNGETWLPIGEDGYVILDIPSTTLITARNTYS